MEINKINDFIAEVEQGQNNITTYFNKVNDLDKVEGFFLDEGFKLLLNDFFNRVLVKCSIVQNGIFNDEYTVYTDIIILSLK